MAANEVLFGWHSRYDKNKFANTGKPYPSIGVRVESPQVGICYSGFHAAPALSQALSYVKGNYISYVAIEGKIEKASDKFCGQYRTSLAEWDISDIFHEPFSFQDWVEADYELCTKIISAKQNKRDEILVLLDELRNCKSAHDADEIVKKNKSRSDLVSALKQSLYYYTGSGDTGEETQACRLYDVLARPHARPTKKESAFVEKMRREADAAREKFLKGRK